MKCQNRSATFSTFKKTTYYEYLKTCLIRNKNRLLFSLKVHWLKKIQTLSFLDGFPKVKVFWNSGFEESLFKFLGFYHYDEHYFAKTRRRVKDQGQKLTDPLSSNQQQIDLKIPFINMLSIYNWQPLKYYCLKRIGWGLIIDGSDA